MPISEQRFVFDTRECNKTKVAHLLIGEPDYGWIERDDLQRLSPDDIKCDAVYDKSIIVQDAFTNTVDAVELCHRLRQLGFNIYVHHVFKYDANSKPIIDSDEWKKINVFLLKAYDADNINYEHVFHEQEDKYSFHDAEELIYGELI